MNFQELYSILNKEQKQAVDHTEGPVMIIAGPGTGKTQVLGARTANLILKSKVDPENIMITTFTEAGVVAIKERLLDFIGTDAHKIYISTIHSFASDVIKTFAEKFEFNKTSTLIDDVDSLEILGEIIENLIKEKKLEYLFSNYDKLFYLSDIKRAIGNLKQEGINTEILKRLINDEKMYYENLLEEKRQNKRIKKIENYEEKYKKTVGKMQEIQIIFDEYNNYLEKKSYYDYNDLINFVLEKFKSDEEIKYYYAEKFQYIMIDEFQDTNNAQNQIIDLILEISPDKQKPNIMVVGDDDQSIYRFQGANIENMLDFSNKYKQTKFIVLEKNYRSKQKILDISGTLIKNNNERLVNKIDSLKKELISMKKENEDNSKTNFYLATNDLDEKNYILEKIKKQNIELNKISIIVRNNREVEEWSNFLQENNIKVESKLKTNILNSHYIDFILKYLEIIDNPYGNEESFIDILRSDLVDVNKLDILEINKDLYQKNYVRRNKIRFFDFLKNLEDSQLELKDSQKLLNFRDKLLELNSKLASLNFVSFFNEFIQEIKIIDYIEKNGNFNDLQDIFSLFQKIKKFSEINKNLKIKNLLNKINLHKKYGIIIERQILKKENDGVQVLTAHSSKGLEFDTVFIPGLYEGNWNNKKIIEKIKLPRGIVGDGLQDLEDEKITKKQKQEEEDRRLFFVAMTRAENKLFLSSSKSKDSKINIVSQFINELGSEINFIESETENDNLTNIIKNSLIGKNSSLIKYEELEFKYIENFLKNYKLSPSDLNKFLEDPSLFLKEAIYKYPFVDNEATIFGKVYHRSLELFFIKYKKENKLPKLDYLIQTFLLLLKKEILSPEEFERLEKRGKQGLEGYYEKYKDNFNEFVALEYNFRGKNIVFNGIPITGKIDKIEKVSCFEKSENPGSTGQFALFKEKIGIIDYKTGSIKGISQIKGIDKNGIKKENFKEGKYGRQLLFYKLLCELDKEFSSKYDIATLGLDFVEGKNNKYKITNVEFSDEEYEQFKELVIKSRKEITDINFWKEVLNPS